MFDDGDEIMADKGFNIRDLTDKIGVKLNLSIFLGARSQFEASETVINQKIASNRIHVERYIKKVKKFRLLDGTIPLFPMLARAIQVIISCLSLSRVLIPVCI